MERGPRASGCRAALWQAVSGLVWRPAEGLEVKGGIEITAAAAVAFIGLVGGWVWKLSGRLAKAEARTTAAEVLASGASVKASNLEKELADHRGHVAAEYLSTDSMKKITTAINRLGDRLDRVFLQFVKRPE